MRRLAIYIVGISKSMDLRKTEDDRSTKRTCLVSRIAGARRIDEFHVARLLIEDPESNNALLDSVQFE